MLDEWVGFMFAEWVDLVLGRWVYYMSLVLVIGE